MGTNAIPKYAGIRNPAPHLWLILLRNIFGMGVPPSATLFRKRAFYFALNYMLRHRQDQIRQQRRRVEELEGCVVVKDNAEQKLAYVYFEDEAERRLAAKLVAAMTRM
jgi:hypothetical protein